MENPRQMPSPIGDPETPRLCEQQPICAACEEQLHDAATGVPPQANPPGRAPTIPYATPDEPELEFDVRQVVTRLMSVLAVIILTVLALSLVVRYVLGEGFGGP
jgi:hypothetical protein